MARIVRRYRAVKNIGHAELADRHDDTIGRLLAAEDIQVGIDIALVAAQAEGLAQEQALQAQIGIGLADLIGLAGRKAGQAQGVGQAETLVDLRIDPKLAALPRAVAEIAGQVEGLRPAGLRYKTVGAGIGRGEPVGFLAGHGRLDVPGPGAVVRPGRRRQSQRAQRQSEKMQMPTDH